MNYTYMLECSDGSLYTGWTSDLKKRFDCHSRGCGSKYTRSRLPLRLIYCEPHKNKKTAMQREYFIKHLTRKQKIDMIRGRA